MKFFFSGLVFALYLLLLLVSDGGLGLRLGLLGALTSHVTEHGRRLERAHIVGALTTEQVDLHDLVLVHGLEGHDALQNKGLGVLHVEVHERHHGNALANALEGGRHLLEVVGLDRGRDRRGLLLAERRLRLLILEGGELVLAVDDLADVQVNEQNDDVRGDVGRAHLLHDRVVFEVDLAGKLVDGKHKQHVSDHRIHFGKFMGKSSVPNRGMTSTRVR